MFVLKLSGKQNFLTRVREFQLMFKLNNVVSHRTFEFTYYLLFSQLLNTLFQQTIDAEKYFTIER